MALCAGSYTNLQLLFLALKHPQTLPIVVGRERDSSALVMQVLCVLGTSGAGGRKRCMKFLSARLCV